MRSRWAVLPILVVVAACSAQPTHESNVAAPSTAAPPAAGPTVLATFEGAVDGAGRLTMSFRRPDTGELIPENLVYGTGAGDVYLHTEGTNGDTMNPAPTYANNDVVATVDAENGTGGVLSNFLANFTSIVPATTTGMVRGGQTACSGPQVGVDGLGQAAYGAPCVIAYGDVAPMSPFPTPFSFASPETWTFYDATGTGFTFSGNVTAPGCAGPSVIIKRNPILPLDVDWRSKGAVTPVKDQGACGGDWAIASAEGLEALGFTTTGTLHTLSAQQIIDCSGSFGTEGCSGGSPSAALAYTAANGIEGQASYPYTATTDPCSYDASSVVLQNTSFQALTGEAALQTAIDNGPVIAEIEDDQPVYQNYTGGIISCGCGTRSNHWVLVVGFTSTYWIVKESRGTGWGSSGYVYIAKGGNYCGIGNSVYVPQ